MKEKREIKFRGLSTTTKTFIYGSLVNNMWTHSEHSKSPTGQKVCEIITGNYDGDCWEDAIIEHSNMETVVFESVGQFTGLTDKNGVDVYEDDLIEFFYDGQYWSGVVSFKEGSFYINVDEIISMFRWYDYSEREVIGNIHQNPELL